MRAHRVRSMPRFVAFLVLSATLAGWAAARAAESGAKPARPPYPRVNLSVSYRVEAGFFQRPAGLAWGETPGIAVDGREQVWVFTREKAPVQVYDRQGKLVRTWGEGLIDRAHYLKIDRDGMVWLSDVGKHVVMQLTPLGKLLKTLGTPGQAGCDRTHLDQPTDVAVAPTGDAFVTDGWGPAPASSASPTPSSSIPAAGSTWPTGTTPGCRSSTRPAAFSASGRTCWSPGDCGSPTATRSGPAAPRPCPGARKTASWAARPRISSS